MQDNSSGEHLFVGKIRPPTRAEGGLTRRRLFRLLDEGVDRGVVIVSGPPGFGKSHLVTEWSTDGQRVPRQVAWLRLDAADRDPARFLRYAIAALRTTPAGRLALSGLSPLPPFSPLDESYLSALQRAMARIPEDVILILEDFEEVVGSETEELVRRVVRYPPERVRLILLTRVEPELGQARLGVAGHLARIRATDLALTLDETRDLLTLTGITLDDSDLRRLHARTEGWVAAVRLAASTLTDEANPATAVGSLPIGIPALTEYLLTEVVDRQPADVRSLMIDTCVVDQVCGGLANALTGRTDGEQVLAQLHRASLLYDAAGEPGHWYRWPQVLSDLLRSRLQAQDPDLKRRLHRTAADWLTREDLPAAAIPQSLAGGDRAAAADTLGECWVDLVASGESAVLTRLLDLFTQSGPLDSADVAVAAAFTALRADEIERGLRLARQAIKLAAEQEPDRRCDVLIMATVAQLYAATMTGQQADSEVAERADRLLADLDHREPPLSGRARIRRALLLYNLGAFELSRQHYGAATEHLSAALDEAGTLRLPYLQLSCHAQLAELQFRAGALTEGEKHGREVLEAAETRGWRSYHGITNAHVGLAGIALLRDDLDTALSHLAEARRIVRPVDRVNRIRISFLTATALCAAGTVVEASAEVAKLRQEASGPDLPEWVPVLVGTAEAGHDACLGRPREGLVRLQALSVDGAGASVVRPFPVLKADLLLRCSRPDEARTVLAPWTGRDYGSPVHVGALVVDALAAEALDRHEDSLARLNEALAAASPERLIQPFVAPGPVVRPLLQDLLDLGTAHEELAIDILRHMTPKPAQRMRTSGRSLLYVEPLSDRETDVLRLLQSTMTNVEIAEKLWISINTVRTHMKSINRKLGTADRRDAVRRARELGIL